MNRRNVLLLKILLFVFVLNSVSLFFYFSSYYSKPLQPNDNPLTQFRENYHGFHGESHIQKSWPILPSYLPWSQTTNSVPLGSCEGYFGNGFTRRLDLLLPASNSAASGGSGWFKCWYSETLRSSICEGGRLKMVPERIQMSKGGERLEEVLGRTEEEELPVYEEGAFEIDGGEGFKGEKKLASEEFLDQYVPKGNIFKHTMRELIGSIQVAGGKNFACDEVREPGWKVESLKDVAYYLDFWL